MEWLNLVGTSLKLLIFQWRAEVAPRLHPVHLQRIVKPSEAHETWCGSRATPPILGCRN